MSRRTANRAAGNPVRTLALLRVLRSNGIAAMLVVWTITVMAIVGAVLVHNTGVDRPFHPSDAAPALTGQAVAQWWIVALVVGTLVLVPVATALTTAGGREQSLLRSWRVTLVTTGEIVMGTWTAMLAFLVLAIILTLPAAGMSLAMGGTSAVQLAVGAAGAFVCGAAVAAVSLAITCTARRVSRALAVIYLLIIVVVGGTVVTHGLRSDTSDSHRGDVVLVVNPVAAVADAAAPRAATVTPSTAATAPLTHLRAIVQPSSFGDPVWEQGLGVGFIVTILSLAIAWVRLRRAGRHL